MVWGFARGPAALLACPTQPGVGAGPESPCHRAMILQLTNAQRSPRQAGEMGLRGQNSWVEAGGRRQCESPLCSWLVMGTIGSTEKPLSSPSGPQPRIWSSLLAGQGEPLGEPQLGFCTEAGRRPGLPGLGQASSLPQPSCPLGKETLDQDSQSQLLLQGCCLLSMWPWAGHLPPAPQGRT